MTKAEQEILNETKKFAEQHGLEFGFHQRLMTLNAMREYLSVYKRLEQ